MINWNSFCLEIIMFGMFLIRNVYCSCKVFCNPKTRLVYREIDEIINTKKMQISVGMFTLV